jgi:nucleotide-binding universal stress UspA family protein
MTTSHAKAVVVGVDGSPDGERAVDYAAVLAHREHLEVRLVHVPHEYVMYGSFTPYVPQVMAREVGESVLRDAAKHADEAGFPSDRVTAVLAHGPRTMALLQHTTDAQYIVLGSRTSAVRHLLTGATSLSVAAHSAVRVRCVPPSWSVSAPSSGRVVAGVDGSDADGVVLEAAFAEADAAGAELEIVHAWPAVRPYDAATTGRVLDEDWERTVREGLTKHIEPVAAAHLSVTWQLRVDYHRVTVALHEAAMHADLLVLGRHGHNGPLGLLVGSNTRTLLHAAPCPLEVVPVSSERG